MLIGYARTSTLDQRPELQLDALTQAGCEKVFVEQASGAQRERPQLKAALEFAREGDTLVVWKLDRLSRSLKQLIETVELLQTRGIAFRSLTEAIDTSGAGGRFVFHVFGALAEFERSIIKERTMAGLAASRARGRRGGRPKQMTTKKIAMAKGMLSNPTITMDDVARELGVSIATLYRHLPGGRGAVQDGSA